MTSVLNRRPPVASGAEPLSRPTTKVSPQSHSGCDYEGRGDYEIGQRDGYARQSGAAGCGSSDRASGQSRGRSFGAPPMLQWQPSGMCFGWAWLSSSKGTEASDLITLAHEGIGEEVLKSLYPTQPQAGVRRTPTSTRALGPAATFVGPLGQTATKARINRRVSTKNPRNVTHHGSISAASVSRMFMTDRQML